jgi:hypothetical protein
LEHFYSCELKEQQLDANNDFGLLLDLIVVVGGDVVGVVVLLCFHFQNTFLAYGHSIM